jgi:hypothetical protein
MKILFSLVLLLSIKTYGQQNTERYKFRTEWLKRVDFDKNGYFEGSSNWIDTSIVILIDIKQKKLIIYGNPTKFYDIVEDAIVYENDEKDFKYLLWTCVDDNANRCKLRFRTDVIKNADGYSNFYLDYSNMSTVFRGKIE